MCSARKKRHTNRNHEEKERTEKCTFVLENDKLTFSIAVNFFLPMQFSTIIISLLQLFISDFVLSACISFYSDLLSYFFFRNVFLLAAREKVGLERIFSRLVITQHDTNEVASRQLPDKSFINYVLCVCVYFSGAKLDFLCKNC